MNFPPFRSKNAKIHVFGDFPILLYEKTIDITILKNELCKF